MLPSVCVQDNMALTLSFVYVHTYLRHVRQFDSQRVRTLVSNMYTHLVDGCSITSPIDMLTALQQAYTACHLHVHAHVLALLAHFCK